MKLDELIMFTKSKLLEGGDSVSNEKILEIFSDSGISELIEKNNAVKLPKRLTVNRIFLSGFKEIDDQGIRSKPFSYYRELGPGINLWISDSDTGKSTILKSIFWAISGQNLNLKEDMLEWLGEVIIEVSIATDKYVIRLLPENKQISGHVYSGTYDVVKKDENLKILHSFPDKRAMVKTLGEFFSSQLQFSPLKWVKPSRTSISLSEVSLNWDIYAQPLFIGDDGNSDYLFSQNNFNGRHHQRTLGMYLGLDLLEAVSNMQMYRDRARYDFSFAKESIKRTSAAVKKSINDMQKSLEEVEDSLSLLESGRSILTNEKYVKETSERVAEYGRIVSRLTEEKRTAEEEFANLLSSLRAARQSRQTLLETIKFKVFLNNFQVKICPRCENSIAWISEEEEINNKKCNLCHNELNPIENTRTHEELLSDLDEQIKEFEQETKKYRKLLSILDKETNQAHSDFEAERLRLADASRQAQIGFSAEIRDLHNKRGYILGRLEELRSQTLEGQAEHLGQLEVKKKVLEIAHKHLEGVMSGEHINLLKKLENDTIELSKFFGVKIDELKIDTRFRLFVTQHNKKIIFHKLTASEMLRVKLAFHLALLSLRVSEGKGRHPAFLILDAPASKELDDKSFENIAAGLREVQSRFGKELQILIGTTNSSLSMVADPTQVEDKHGEPFF